jgi:hypothetical protein
VSRVYKAPLELRVLLVQQVHRVLLGFRVPRVSKDCRAPLGLRVLLVPKVPRDLQDHKVRPVNRAFKDHPV